MAYYLLVEMRDDSTTGDPMTAPEAQKHNRQLFERLYWLMQALIERDEARAAGQMDLFSGRPIDADKPTTLLDMSEME
jgi:hypothetical protein